MAKTRTRFVCSDCGHVTGQWVGKCPSCKAWNTVTEFKESANPRMERAAVAAGVIEARPLVDYTEHKTDRAGTGEPEFDRVLGGGLVPGALVLLGGEPGIGKSTLSLQTAMKAAGKVLYVVERKALNRCACGLTAWACWDLNCSSCLKLLPKASSGR